MTRKTKEMIIVGSWVFASSMVFGFTPLGPWLYAQDSTVAYVIMPLLVGAIGSLMVRLTLGKPGQT